MPRMKQTARKTVGGRTPRQQQQQQQAAAKTVPAAAKVRTLGKEGAMTEKRRHKRVLKSNIMGVGKPAIRRMARRGGVKRISGLIYDETRSVLKIFLENVIRDAVTYTEYAGRKTVTARDVCYALRLKGKTLYGTFNYFFLTRRLL